MNKSGWALGALAVLAGLFPFFEPSFCEYLYRSLRFHDQPRGSDAIVVFCGGGGGRVTTSLDLFSKGFAPKVLVLGNRPELECASSLASELGVASERVEFAHRPAKTTSESVEVLYEWMTQNPVDRLLIVSDREHLGRIRAHIENRPLESFEAIFVNSERPPNFLSHSARGWFYFELAKYAAVRVGGLLRPGNTQGLSPVAYASL